MEEKTDEFFGRRDFGIHGKCHDRCRGKLSERRDVYLERL